MPTDEQRRKLTDNMPKYAAHFLKCATPGAYDETPIVGYVTKKIRFAQGRRTLNKVGRVGGDEGKVNFVAHVASLMWGKFDTATLGSAYAKPFAKMGVTPTLAKNAMAQMHSTAHFPGQAFLGGLIQTIAKNGVSHASPNDSSEPTALAPLVFKPALAPAPMLALPSIAAGAPHGSHYVTQIPPVHFYPQPVPSSWSPQGEATVPVRPEINQSVAFSQAGGESGPLTMLHPPLAYLSSIGATNADPSMQAQSLSLEAIRELPRQVRELITRVNAHIDSRGHPSAPPVSSSTGLSSVLSQSGGTPPTSPVSPPGEQSFGAADFPPQQYGPLCAEVQSPQANQGLGDGARRVLFADEPERRSYDPASRVSSWNAVRARRPPEYQPPSTVPHQAPLSPSFPPR